MTHTELGRKLAEVLMALANYHEPNIVLIDAENIIAGANLRSSSATFRDSKDSVKALREFYIS